MTAPAADAPAVDIPEGTVPIRLPVMVVEGMWTSDGRFLEPGSLSTGIMPITLYSQTRSSHGSLDGDTSTVIVGAITEAVRKPGPEVTQLSTGQPFPEGTFVWEGTGWMYQDVPAPPDKPAYQLVKDKALRGNSVDLSQVDANFEYDEGQDLANDPQPRRIRITEGVINGTTLVGMPAFPDAYIELDGEAMAMATPEEALAASAVPFIRSADLGDACGPCTALEGPGDALVREMQAVTPGDDEVARAFLLNGADIDPEDITPTHTGGMVALIPSNPNMLTVPGGDPAEELHLTLMYLGEDVTGWTDDDVAALLGLGQTITDYEAMIAHERAEAERKGIEVTDYPMQPVPDRPKWQQGPITGSIFSHAIFNPNGDNGHDPATVYLLDGTEDRYAIEGLHETVCYQVRDALGTAQLPEQHSPFVPHVTAGYGVPIDQLTYTGPVEFDRLRIALGDQNYDFPLGGASAVTASATPPPPAEWFENPGFTEPTAPTVDADGRAYGHLACWGTCHIGFNGKCITPPRSASSYAYFMVHSTVVRDADGQDRTIPVGYGTIGTGHADIRRDALAAAEHYDNTGTVAFEYAVGEDDHGIWFAGRMLPGLTEDQERRARGTVFSGDWRTIRGNLELVASLGVNTPGFPVPRVRVASGAPLTLVAAGVPTREEAPHVSIEFSDDVIRSVRMWQTSEIAAAFAEVEALTGDAHDWAVTQALAELTHDLDADHPWFSSEGLAELGELDGDEDFAKRKNWVAKSGGLPKYIKRIAKHLQQGGMEEGHAIAAAKNAAQKMCDTGDLNFPGSQKVNPGSRAEACEAIAQWNAKRKAS